MKHLVLVLTAVGLLVGLAACGDPSPELKNVGAKAGELWNAAKDYGFKKKDQFFEAAKPQMEKV